VVDLLVACYAAVTAMLLGIGFTEIKEAKYLGEGVEFCGVGKVCEGGELCKGGVPAGPIQLAHENVI
jgi:hypothetical protein